MAINNTNYINEFEDEIKYLILSSKNRKEIFNNIYHFNKTIEKDINELSNLMNLSLFEIMYKERELRRALLDLIAIKDIFKEVCSNICSCLDEVKNE